MSPTIIIVPGLWEGPKPFTKLASLLTSKGYNVETVSLASTGTTSPGNPTMLDDIATIRETIEKHSGLGQELLLVLHSAGGFLGSAAMDGFALNARKEKGLKGGVAGIFFLAAGIAPEGFKHQPLPFFEYDGGAVHCKSPKTLLFNDLSPSETATWLSELQPQPASGWDDVISYAGWKDVKSWYLVCKNDKIVPEEMQVSMAGLAGSEVLYCDAGHMAQLSMPEVVFERTREVAEGL